MLKRTSNLVWHAVAQNTSSWIAPRVRGCWRINLTPAAMIFAIGMLGLMLTGCEKRCSSPDWTAWEASYQLTTNHDVRGATCLGELKDPKGFEPLLAALRDQKAVVREWAISALGQLNDTRAVEPLIAVLKDPEPSVRERATTVLGNMKDSRAVEPLIVALKDPELVVGDDGPSIGIRAPHFAASALVEIGAPATGPLIEALKSSEESSQVRQYAVWILGKIHNTGAVEPLIAALKDRDVEVRKMAISALVEIQDQRAIQPLTATFLKGNEDGNVRYEAALALGKLGLFDPLLSAIKGADTPTRLLAAHALGETGKPVIESLIATLKEKNTGVRYAVAMALGSIDDPRAASALLAAWNGRDYQVIAGAAQFFVSRNEPGSDDVLIEALRVSREPEMARILLNAHGTKLEAAGREWAKKNGYWVYEWVRVAKH